ncbi:hypothetical protein KL86CLO1_12851 [uncultured Eubacteriales bacterium]|uniref:Uncharacterized protein n=1 Tax=uncultured Eubacteriales bacterium TaxID=172733 RepID=A0A212KEK8_9FIRM|nr:hypothetical protein KL86CLO1_12851 [uncultured Eubacteriales bacterium]
MYRNAVFNWMNRKLVVDIKCVTGYNWYVVKPIEKQME